MSELAAEDAKLLALARQARSRIQASEGAAVRDDTGRSYSGASVSVGSLHLTALELAIAQAIAAGASDIESAVVVTAQGGVDATSLAAIVSTATPLHICSPSGEVVASTIVEP